MVIPADPEEMKQFQAQCEAQCQCALDINLPQAYILLPSKQAFQSIYNRYRNRRLMAENRIVMMIKGLIFNVLLNLNPKDQ